MKEKLVNLLRWIGAIILPLPILILVYFIASIIVSIQNPDEIMSAPHIISFPDDFIIPGVAGFLSGAASVGISRLMAPSHNKIVGWTFATIITTFEIFNLYCLVLAWNDCSVFEIYTTITANITCIIGAITTATIKLDHL